MIRVIWTSWLSVLLITLFAQTAVAKRIRFSPSLPMVFHSVSDHRSPSIVNAMDLPDIPQLQHESGAYIDLGYNFKDKAWIGYIGDKTKYLKLSDEKLTEILKISGVTSLPFIPFRNGMSRRSTSETPSQISRRARAERLAQRRGFKPRRFDEDQMQFQFRVFAQEIRDTYNLRDRLEGETPAQYQKWVFAEKRIIRAKARTKKKADRGVVATALGWSSALFPLLFLAGIYYAMHRVKVGVFNVIGGVFGFAKKMISKPEKSQQTPEQEASTQAEAFARAEIQRMVRERAAPQPQPPIAQPIAQNGTQPAYKTTTPDSRQPAAPAPSPLSYEELLKLNTYNAQSRQEKPKPKYSTVTKTAKIFGQQA